MKNVCIPSINPVLLDDSRGWLWTLSISYLLLDIFTVFQEIFDVEKNILVGKTTLRLSVSSLCPLWLDKKVNYKQPQRR
ncbi:hypothetical protein D1164_04290 [Mariniphaga sediminis]|uniref:Uncharacterized protein n=1 Tax=Mariniphaga sediminis TaxID=1628158 RepID=A0A399D4H9_9BACT|nr:hypothetical protein D1164_04290 [Mariniphaga sediminis]